MLSTETAYASNVAFAAEITDMVTLHDDADSTADLLDELSADLSIPDKIRLQAKKYGVDESTALNIACAESNFIASARNGHSTAGGVYQFLDGTWAHYGIKFWGSLDGRDKLNADDNIELAIRAIALNGTGDWNASKFEGLGGGWSNKPFERGLCS